MIEHASPLPSMSLNRRHEQTSPIVAADDRRAIGAVNGTSMAMAPWPWHVNDVNGHDYAVSCNIIILFSC